MHVPGDCPKVASILSRVGDKWSILVVLLLGDGPMRFNELRRRVGGISQRMLTLTLRGLERDGFVTRTVFPSVPPRVDYELTALGHSLLFPVRALGAWALRNADEIEDARRRFDRAAAKDAPAASDPGRRHDPRQMNGDLAPAAVAASTPILKADDAALAKAARLLRAGKLVAFPTETVYGLGADATSEAAVARIYAAKGRPAFNPLIAHVANLSGGKGAGDLFRRRPAPRRAFLAGALDAGSAAWPPTRPCAPGRGPAGRRSPCASPRIPSPCACSPPSVYLSRRLRPIAPAGSARSPRPMSSKIFPARSI